MGGAAQDTSFAHIPNNTHPKWWKDPGLKRNVIHVIGICLCPFYLGYDQSLLAGLQAIPGWRTYFGLPSGLFLGLIAACIFLPALIMCFVADWFCTKFGRKKVIYLGSVLIVIGAIFNALSQNAGHFMGSRVIIGTGGAITKVAAPSLLQEICHPRYRGRAGTSYYSFYYSGSLTAALMCVAGLYIPGTWTWRLPCIIQVIGPTAVMLILWDCPESPRWLIKQGRSEEAKAILTKYHANGAAHDELVNWQMQSIHSSLLAEESMGKSSYADFFKTPGNRKRLFVNCLLGLASNWVGNGIITYYLAPVLRQSAGITQPNIILGINAGYAAFNWICSFLAGTNSERLGRRFLWLACNIGMGVSFCFVMGFAAGFANTGSAGLGIAVIPWLFIVHLFYDIGYIAMNYSYSVEIMPYNLRTKGLALYIFFNNLGNAFNQFVNPFALAALQWRYYAVYIAIDFGMAILVWFYFPETSRMTIEEISMVFDYPVKDARRLVLEALEEKRNAEQAGGKMDEAAADGEVLGEQKPSAVHVEKV